MKNLKIGYLLGGSFGVIIFFAAILGIMGTAFTTIINTQYTNTITPSSKALDYLTDMWLYYDDLKYYTNIALIYDDRREDALSKTEDCFSKIQENEDNLYSVFPELDFNDTEKKAFETINTDLSKLLSLQKEFISHIKNGNMDSAKKLSRELYSGDLTEKFEENLDTVYYSINDLTTRQKEHCTTTAWICTALIAILLLATIVIGTFFAAYITKMLKKEIIKIKSAAKEISRGNLDITLQSKYHNELGELTNSINDIVNVFKSMLSDINDCADKIEKGALSAKINSEEYEKDYKKVIDAINYTTELLKNDLLESVDTMSSYAEGNFNTKVKRFNGEKAVIHEKLDTVQKNLIDITKDIETLINSALKGDLSIRIDSTNYNGDWKNIAENFNRLMFSINEPISEVSKVLSDVSKADFSQTIKGEYYGEFALMKESVNKTVETNSDYINEISDILNKMADNNLDINIERKYIGDYSEIKTSIEKILSSFNRILNEISTSADEITLGSKQIAESSAVLADKATSQALSVEHLNSSVKDVLRNVSDNKEIMKNSNTLAITTKEKAFDSKEKMDNMLTAMNELGTVSKQISSIINVISDIAFQTNILALNAAVEAARAGNNGKGFAVVAEEVRNLASRSQAAVRNTDELLSNIVEKIELGVNITKETVTVLDEVVSDVENISEVILKSCNSSEDTLKSIKTISDEISTINSVTQSNTSNSEESAAVSEELASQSELFRKTLSNFKLRQN